MFESLVKPTGELKQKSIKINISGPLVEAMQDYMEKAGFESEEDFISKCIDFVIGNDKRYKKIKKSKSQNIN